MRLVLAILAILAILALVSSPVTASAAQGACSQSGTMATAVVDMPAMPGVNHGVTAKSALNPCCDPGVQHQHKMNNKGCAKACASSYVAIAGLSGSPVSFTRAYVRAGVSPARVAAVLSYRPSGPERPPKSMG